MRQQIEAITGFAEYTQPVTLTETTGKDISSATVTVSVGTQSDPGPWVTPSVLTRPTPQSVTAKLLLNAATGLTVGTRYFLWLRIGDTPEVIGRRTPLEIQLT